MNRCTLTGDAYLRSWLRAGKHVSLDAEQKQPKPTGSKKRAGVEADNEHEHVYGDNCRLIYDTSTCIGKKIQQMACGY